MKNENQFELFVLMSAFIEEYLKEQDDSEINGVKDNWIKIRSKETIMLPVLEEFQEEMGVEKSSVSKISWMETKADRYRISPMSLLLGFLELQVVSNQLTEHFGQKSISYDEEMDLFTLDLNLLAEAIDTYEEALDFAGEQSLFEGETNFDRDEIGDSESKTKEKHLSENKKREMN